jgi:RNA polymerase sigma-70 factor, ECF subfamily
MDMTSTHTRFATLYETHFDSIFRYCVWKLSDRETAKDIVQESFLRLWDALVKEEKMRNEKAFLFTVARRLVIDHYRKKKSLSLDSKIDEEDESEPADPRTFDEETGAAGRYALDAINRLDPAARHVIYLRFVEDLSPKEIADVLDISPNAASVRIDRGLKKLKELLDPNKTYE